MLKFDKIREKDASTGKFIIKEYLFKASNFFEDLNRILTSPD